MGDFFTALGDALDAGAQAVLEAIVYVFELLLAVAQFIWNVLVAVANFIFQLISDIGKFFSYIWDHFFKALFGKLLGSIIAFGKFLHNIFGPVVTFLKSVSTYIQRLYNTYLKPILKIIRIARVFLQLLKALHIKWAAKLDSILGTVQNDIQHAFLLVKGYLNVIIDALNIITDPTALLRRPTTLLSLLRIWHASVRMFTGLPPGFFFPSPSASAPLGLGFLGSNFDAKDPLQNPPPSYYLTLDSPVADFSSLAPGETIPDEAADGMQPIDYFNDDLYQESDCLDPAQCRDEIIAALIGDALNG